MASETIVSGPDQYGNDKYKLLYEEIMYDIGKLAMLDRSYLLLKPEVPLFVISIRLKARPAAKMIGDVAMTRAERGNVYVSISDEMYAPGTLKSLWKAYGRDNVQQTDRLDITVRGPDTSAEVDAIEVESQEQPVQEVIGALWRVMPEGIRNRRVLTDGNTITVMATEEIVRPEHMREAQEIHDKMVRGEDPNV